MSHVIGIDPGKEGYVCILGESKESNVFTFKPTPLLEDDFDHRVMAGIAWAFRDLGVRLIVIEQQMPFPGKGVKCYVCHKPKYQQGVASTFETGKGFGIWLGVLAMVGLPVRVVLPQEWKGPLGLDADKQKSIDKAQQLRPDIDFRPLERTPKARVPDHNKCEAFLLAITARRLLQGAKT